MDVKRPGAVWLRGAFSCSRAFSKSGDRSLTQRKQRKQRKSRGKAEEKQRKSRGKAEAAEETGASIHRSGGGSVSRPRQPQTGVPQKNGSSWIWLHAAHPPVASSQRATPCPAHRSSRGARGFPEAVGDGRRMKARQGAIRIFFGNPMVLHGAPQAAIRLHPMRDLVNRATSRPRRERAGISGAEILKDRAAGVRGGWVRCACDRHPPRRMIGG
jgi:hypothetical protein